MYDELQQPLRTESIEWHMKRLFVIDRNTKKNSILYKCNYYYNGHKNCFKT